MNYTKQPYPSWEEIDWDIRQGHLSPTDLSSAQWNSILEQSARELQEKQDPLQNARHAPYCNIYARNRLLQAGIYMPPGQNANRMIDGISGENAGWKRIPKKTVGEGRAERHLDHEQAQRLAEKGYTVIIAYRNPDGQAHGHIALINARAGMKQSGKNAWNAKVPSIDGYNPRENKVREGESLSWQFSSSKEMHMEYYYFEKKIRPR